MGGKALFAEPFFHDFLTVRTIILGVQTVTSDKPHVLVLNFCGTFNRQKLKTYVQHEILASITRLFAWMGRVGGFRQALRVLPCRPCFHSRMQQKKHDHDQVTDEPVRWKREAIVATCVYNPPHPLNKCIHVLPRPSLMSLSFGCPSHARKSSKAQLSVVAFVAQVITRRPIPLLTANSGVTLWRCVSPRPNCFPRALHRASRTLYCYK